LKKILNLLLVVIFIAAFCFLTWQGRWLGIVGWFLTVMLLIDHGARILFDIYGEQHSWSTGIIFWIASIFMGILSVQIVTRDGKILKIRPSGPLASVFARLGARGLIIVENGVAVIMERSGRNTTIQGPGLYWTKRYEFIAQVVPLQPRLTERDVEGVQTVDGMSLNIRPLTVVYRVAQNFDPNTGRYVYNDADIRNLFYMGGHLYTTDQEENSGKNNSEKTEDEQDRKPSEQRLVMPDERIHRLVEQGLRNTLATRSLTDILTSQAGSTRQQIVQATLLAATPQATALGVQIDAIELGRLEVAPEYKQFQASLVQQTTIERIVAGLQTSLRNMLTPGTLPLAQSLEQTDPQIAAMLTTMVEQVLQRVVPLPTIPDGPEGEGQQPSRGRPPSDETARQPGGGRRGSL